MTLRTSYLLYNISSICPGMEVSKQGTTKFGLNWPVIFIRLSNSLGDIFIPIFHQSSDCSGGCVELGHFVLLYNGPESSSVRMERHSLKLKEGKSFNKRPKWNHSTHLCIIYKQMCQAKEIKNRF